MTPKISIIILNWNGWEDTIECLESLYQIAYPNYEVILVDNNSQDDSIVKIKDYCQGKIKVESKFFKYDPNNKPIKIIDCKGKKSGASKEKEVERLLLNKKLVLIKNRDNLGFAGGNNIGIRYALAKEDCEYIWLLNNDTVVDRHALSEMVKLAESDSKIGIIGSKVLFYDSPDTIQAVGGKDKAGWAFATIYEGEFEKDDKKWCKNIELHGYIIGASLLVKRKVIDDIGLMDNKYFMFNEEIDWGVRAKKRKWRLFGCGKSKLWHKAGRAHSRELKRKKNFLGKPIRVYNFKGFAFRKYYETRNGIYFVKKNFPKYFLPFCLFVLPLKTIYKIVEVILYNDCKVKRMKIIFRAIHDGMIGKMGKTIGPKTL